MAAEGRYYVEWITQEIIINLSIQESFIKYMKAYPKIAENHDSFLFLNQKSKRPIRRGQAWKFIT